MMEKAVSGLFLLFSVTYLSMASKLSFGSFLAPKAGFMPVLAGATAVLLTAACIIAPLQRAEQGPTNWRKLFFLLIGLLAYVALLPLVGYAVITFTLMLYLLKVTDTAGWLYPSLIAGFVAGGFYCLFGGLLGINLP